MVLGVDLDIVYSIDPSYSNVIHTIVIILLSTKSSSIDFSCRVINYILGLAD